MIESNLSIFFFFSFFLYLACNFIVGRRQTSRFSLSLIGCTLLISVVFLIATLATGFLLPTNHHVLHWRCQTYYIACLIIGDILLAIVQLSGNAIKVKSAECISIGKLNVFIKMTWGIRVICMWYWIVCYWANKYTMYVWSGIVSQKRPNGHLKSVKIKWIWSVTLR